MLRMPQASQLYVDSNPIGHQLEWNQSLASLLNPRLITITFTLGNPINTIQRAAIGDIVGVGDVSFNRTAKIFATVVEVSDSDNIVLDHYITYGSDSEQTVSFHKSAKIPSGYKETDGSEIADSDSFLFGETAPSIPSFDDWFEHGAGTPINENTQELFLDGISDGITSKGLRPTSANSICRREFYKETIQPASQRGFPRKGTYYEFGNLNASQSLLPIDWDDMSRTNSTVRLVGKLDDTGPKMYAITKTGSASTTSVESNSDLDNPYFDDYQIVFWIKQNPSLGEITTVTFGSDSSGSQLNKVVSFDHTDGSIVGGTEIERIKVSEDIYVRVLSSVTYSERLLFHVLHSDSANAAIGSEVVIGGVKLQTPGNIAPEMFDELVRQTTAPLSYNHEGSDVESFEFKLFNYSPVWGSGRISVHNAAFTVANFDETGASFRVHYSETPEQSRDNYVEFSFPLDYSGVFSWHQIKVVLNFSNTSDTKLFFDGESIPGIYDRMQLTSALRTDKVIFPFSSSYSVFCKMTNFVLHNYANTELAGLERTYFDPKKLITKGGSFSLDKYGNMFVKKLIEASNTSIKVDYTGGSRDSSYIVFSNGLKIAWGTFITTGDILTRSYVNIPMPILFQDSSGGYSQTPQPTR